MPSSPLFIAEVSSNHAANLDRCLQFIDVAADIGCDAVKFQLFQLEQLFSKEVLVARPEVLQRKAWELPVAFLPALAQRCRERNVLFGCTPFHLGAVDELFPYVDFYKVASYELLWDELLRACAQTGKPLVVSTGMATMDEVRHAVDIVLATMRSNTTDIRVQSPHLGPLTLLHCVSGYPAPPEQCNLAAIQTLRQEFNRSQISNALPQVSGFIPHPLSIGWSDHSTDASVLLQAALRWSASVIEFHLDLDRAGEEYGGGHCWLPDEIGPVIEQLRSGTAANGGVDLLSKADGDGVKRPSPCEAPDREWRADTSDGLRPLLALRKGLLA